MPVPNTVFQGTTFEADIVCPQRPPSAWTGTLRLTKTGQTDINIIGSGVGNKHIFTATPAQTQTWLAGRWNWTFLVTDGTDVFVIHQGSLTVAEINGAETALEAAKDAIHEVREALKQASGQPSSYSIKDRSLTRRTVDELLKLESYWQRRIQDLQADVDAKCNTKTGNRRITYGRFTKWAN